LLWNLDQTRVANVNKTVSRNIIVAKTRGLETRTIDETKDNAQLSLFVAISALGDSTMPPFVSKVLAFEKDVLTAQNQYESHDHPLRTADNICHGSFLSPPIRPAVFSSSSQSAEAIRS
jgi:hypothetical protein